MPSNPSSKPLALSKDLTLPVDAATQTFAFLGRKGSGKTYAAGKLVELLLDAHVQVVILDTVGNWYGLRLSADGKKRGFDVPVIGGLRGDIPLEEAGGALIADTLTDTGRSAIIDVSQFSLAARQRFATAFGEKLWQKKKADHQPAPLTLVIEECQLIIPQNVRADQARMVGIYEEIVRLGRNYGIGAVMVSQRPQSVNKEVLTQTECLCVFQTNGSQERDALKKWIVAQGADVNLVQELPGLPVGTCYLWSPQWLGTFRRLTIAPKVTFDASATPKVGTKRPNARELAPLNLDDLAARMREVVERAKHDDPKALRKRIAELETELKHKPQATGKTKTVEVPVLTGKTIAHIERLAIAVETLQTKVRAAAAPQSIAALGSILRSPPGIAIEHAIVPAAAPKHGNGHDTTDGTVGEGEKKILTAAAQRSDGATREQLTLATGYKRATRNTYIQRLRAKGLVSESGDRIVVTEAGRVWLDFNGFEPLPTGPALLDHWLRRLPEGEGKVLALVAKHHPRPVSRDMISDATGYKRATRNTYLQRLATRHLVRADRDGSVTASAELF